MKDVSAECLSALAGCLHVDHNSRRSALELSYCSWIQGRHSNTEISKKQQYSKQKSLELRKTEPVSLGEAQKLVAEKKKSQQLEVLLNLNQSKYKKYVRGQTVFIKLP